MREVTSLKELKENRELGGHLSFVCMIAVILSGIWSIHNEAALSLVIVASAFLIIAYMLKDYWATKYYMTKMFKKLEKK